MSESPVDINFCYPFSNRVENDRVALVPFDPSKHARGVWEGTNQEDTILNGAWRFMPVGPYKDPKLWSNLCTQVTSSPTRHLLPVVYSKTPEGRLAGLVGYISTSKDNLSTEIEAVITFPQFQGKAIASKSVGLLLHYALDLPAHGGLGFRRSVLALT
ncbi:hypothetical protein C8J56DRAFT_935797, partial [Mycena floridula]